MKRKGFYPPGTSLFKWHLIGFIFFILLVGYSVEDDLVILTRQGW